MLQFHIEWPIAARSDIKNKRRNRRVIDFYQFSFSDKKPVFFASETTFCPTKKIL